MPHNDPNTALPQIGSASHPKTARDSGINPIASSDQQHTYQTDSQVSHAAVKGKNLFTGETLRSCFANSDIICTWIANLATFLIPLSGVIFVMCIWKPRNSVCVLIEQKFAEWWYNFFHWASCQCQAPFSWLSQILFDFDWVKGIERLSLIEFGHNTGVALFRKGER